MSARNPLVIIGGQVQELPAGDTVNGATGTPIYVEPVLVAGGNADVVYQEGSNLVPDFVVTTDGDMVFATGV